MTLSQLMAILQQVADHEDPNTIEVACEKMESYFVLSNWNKITEVRYIKDFNTTENKHRNTLFMIHGDK